MSLPDLRLKWAVRVDFAACFGIYRCGAEPFLISHGEVEIARWTLEGRVAWTSCGA